LKNLGYFSLQIWKFRVLKNDRPFLRTGFCPIFRSERVIRGSRTGGHGKNALLDFSEIFFFSFASPEPAILTENFPHFFFFRKIFFFLAIFSGFEKNLDFLFFEIFDFFGFFIFLDFLFFWIFYFFGFFIFLDFLFFWIFYFFGFFIFLDFLFFWIFLLFYDI
jgi:hypothetical protein